MTSKVLGRYPATCKHFAQENMVIETQVYSDFAIIRVDDQTVPEFWLELTLTKEKLQKMLQEMEELEVEE